MPRGMFGNIEVRESNGGRHRLLFLNGQCQGGMWVEDGQPTPVPCVAYASGWYAAAASRPEAECLMLGLGSGGGAISLLHNFPKLMLTVVEIDPVMIDQARTAFPDLVKLEDSGRLEIVEADAADYTSDCPAYDLGLYDLYDGGRAVLDQVLPQMLGCCTAVYINAIDTLDGQSLGRCRQAIEETGRGQPFLMRVQDEKNGQKLANWIIVADDDIDPQAVDFFVPFADMKETLPVLTARDDYQLMLSQVREFGSASKS